MNDLITNCSEEELTSEYDETNCNIVSDALDSEKQRRREVVEMAERLYLNFINTDIDSSFMLAEKFVNMRRKYMQTGEIIS